MGGKSAEFKTKVKKLLKGLFATKAGWLSWIIANLIMTLPWVIPFVIGFIFNEKEYYVVGTSIFLFMATPITPFWILNVFIALFILKKFFKKTL